MTTPRRLRPGTIVLTPSYIAPDHYLRCRIRQRTTRHSPRFGHIYSLESLDPHPYRFITRSAPELTLPLSP
jgi:hypothetical protein